jgi:hypothetical protein
MKNIVFLTFAFVFVLATQINAQTHREDTAAIPADPLELAKPGPAHEELSAYVGPWLVTIRLGAGDSAIDYTGTASNRMAIGNRFLVYEISAKGAQRALEGMFTIGFDRRHSEYTIQAIDSWGTYFVTARGQKEGTPASIKLYGTDDDPHMKSLGLTKEFAYVLDLSDGDSFSIEVLMIDTRTEERHEMKMMEYRFTRVESK